MNRSPFGGKLRRSIMDFQRSSGFFHERKQPDAASPEAFRKRYTQTLSEGFKEYFSSYPLDAPDAD